MGTQQKIKGLARFERSMGIVPETITTWTGAVGILHAVNLETEYVTYRFNTQECIVEYFTVSVSEARAMPF